MLDYLGELEDLPPVREGMFFSKLGKVGQEETEGI
jgi:hypothetical protein